MFTKRVKTLLLSLPIIFVSSCNKDYYSVGIELYDNQFEDLKSKIFPQDSEITKGPFTISSTDQRLDMRARGRSFQARYETDATGVSWRLGTWRAEGRVDGAR